MDNFDITELMELGKNKDNLQELINLA